MGKKRLTLRLALIPHWLGGGWLNMFMPANHARIGMVMADSLRNEMIVTDSKPAKHYFPHIKPKSLDQALMESTDFLDKSSPSVIAH